MTIIELLETAAAMLKQGKNKDDVSSWMKIAGVDKKIIHFVLDGLNDNGSYRRIKI